MERAKKLLAGIKNEGMDSTEMEQELRESTRISKVTEYGEERLPAGPDVENSKEVIVAEGRADVVNLLKHGIKNVIGMDGTKLPKTIAKLGEEKEITLFVDGDRGGKLIAKNVCDNAKVAFITSAPDGKEVEELTGKELLQALRKKVPAEVFLKGISRDSRGSRDFRDSRARDSRPVEVEESEIPEKRALTADDKAKLREFASEIKGRNVLILNEDMEVVKNIPASKLSFLKINDAFILMASNATGLIIQGAEKLKARAVAAKTFGKVPETDVEMVSI
jgi:DNA primase